IFLLLFVVLLFSGCSQKQKPPVDLGVIVGKVTIGPLCPVEPCTLTAGQLAKYFDARKVVVWDANKTKIIAVANLKSDGSYKVELSPGTYVVDINGIGIDSSADVPKEVFVGPGTTAELNIDIDSGIR
ncbi:MAG: hypothetical protein V1909_04415, partial [Candidatus Micrarchaeota archaeon]